MCTRVPHPTPLHPPSAPAPAAAPAPRCPAACWTRRPWSCLRARATCWTPTRAPRCRSSARCWSGSRGRAAWATRRTRWPPRWSARTRQAAATSPWKSGAPLVGWRAGWTWFSAAGIGEGCLASSQRAQPHASRVECTRPAAPPCEPPAGPHPHPCPHQPIPRSSIKRQLRTALSERDGQTQRANELQAQLQDKKRQLFSAIQVGLHAGGVLPLPGARWRWSAGGAGHALACTACLRCARAAGVPGSRRARPPLPCPAMWARRSARACASRCASWRTSAGSSRRRCSARSAAR